MPSLRLILCISLSLYYYILIARAVLSFIPLFKPDWSPPDFLRPVVDLIYGLTEPALQLLRRVIPQPMGFPFDLSFLILIFLVPILRGVLGCTGA